MNWDMIVKDFLEQLKCINLHLIDLKTSIDKNNKLMRDFLENKSTTKTKKNKKPK